MTDRETAQNRIECAVRALGRAHSEEDVNETLRCLHNANYLIKEAWALIVGSRFTGELPVVMVGAGLKPALNEGAASGAPTEVDHNG